MTARSSGPAPATPPALPTTASVCARQPDLPGLAAMLDPARRAAALAPIVGDLPMEVTRLRLKPGTSVSFALRPAAEARAELAAGRAHGWWRARAFAPEPFLPKADKECVAAERHRLPVLVDEDLRLVVSPAETDRDLRGLAWLRPDSGSLVAVQGSPRTVHTLSYNPDRRWVGVARDPFGRPRSVLRLYSGDRALHVDPWAPGRPWSADDATDRYPDLERALREGLATRVGPPGSPGSPGGPARGFDLDQLDQAARFLATLDEGWGERAHAVVRAVGPRLGAVELVPAHGDLSPDQVVVDEDGRVSVLDWDRAGWWPLGWDSATWEAGSTLFLPGTPASPEDCRLPGHRAPEAVVRAGASLLYTPDPFRRQLPDWAAGTERLLARAEAGLS